MRNESGGYLAEIQNQLEKTSEPAMVKPKSDDILTVVTNALEESEEIKLEPLQIQPTQDGQLSITVGSDKQLKLSTFLPEGLKFVSGADFSVNKPKGELVVPTDKFNTNKPLGFRMKLAHEIGHGLDPDYEVLDSECKIEGDTVSVVLQQENARLQMEVNAWNYGKAIADAMGVDEIHYEDITHHALKAYQMSALEKLAMVIDEDTTLDKQSEIELYNPITQDTENLSIQALRDRIEKLYEANEILTATEKLKRIAKK